MAKLKAPLLSLGATGQLGKTLVASTWKGIKVMREYVVPANPNTTAQQTQRTLFSSAVHAWQNYLTAAAIITGWDVWANLGADIMTGFNAAMSSLCKVLAADPDASFAVDVNDDGGGDCHFLMENMDDGAAGDEAGNFITRKGASKDSLSDVATNATIVAGDITIATGAGTWYVQVLKILDGVRVARSGVTQIVVTA